MKKYSILGIFDVSGSMGANVGYAEQAVAMAAKEMGYIEIFEIFFHRAYELGSVSKQEYREYQMEKLGI